jgi:hypothetical protein
MAKEKLQIKDIGIGDKLKVSISLNHPANGVYHIRGLIDDRLVVRSNQGNKWIYEVMTPELFEILQGFMKWKKSKKI